MVSCSNDGTLRVWKYLGDVWTSYSIHPSKMIGSAAINEKARVLNSKAQEDISVKSKHDFKYKITCIQVAWKDHEIYTGDNKGYICIYDLKSGTLKQEMIIEDSKVRRISLVNSGNLIGVALKNGRCLLVENSDKLKIKIELEGASAGLDLKKGCFRGKVY